MAMTAQTGQSTVECDDCGRRRDFWFGLDTTIKAALARAGWAVRWSGGGRDRHLSSYRLLCEICVAKREAV